SGFAALTLPRLYPGMEGVVVYCPVPEPPPGLAAERAAVRAELETADDAVVVVQVSRMEPWKGHRLHLEALGRLRDLPGWTCWLVGGAQRPHEQAHLAAMRALAERLGIAERVRFAGERTDVRRVLAAADLACQPNLGPEPFGITFVEALHAGLPVVATALGGAPEVVDPACGVLVPPDDPEALAAVLAELLGDAALRRRLGAAGPARARALCGVPTQLAKLHGVLAGAAAARRAA
ncbi:MAG TPA: glycosyltransferase, partial [Longimicrobiaceae bacterium]|nr:glycosyltransferase [Longimicrobiaceae bacterium]